MAGGSVRGRLAAWARAVAISFDEHLKGGLEEERSLGAKFGASANGKKQPAGAVACSTFASGLSILRSVQHTCGFKQGSSSG